jgi:hypothetical protein
VVSSCNCIADWNIYSENANAADQRLILNGIDPGSLTSQQLAAFQSQTPLSEHSAVERWLELDAAEPETAGSPLMPQTSESVRCGPPSLRR